MKGERSRTLLREIRAINQAIKRVEKARPKYWRYHRSGLMNERALLVVKYIKSLRLQSIDVGFLKSLLL